MCIYILTQEVQAATLWELVSLKIGCKHLFQYIIISMSMVVTGKIVSAPMHTQNLKLLKGKVYIALSHGYDA